LTGDSRTGTSKWTIADRVYEGLREAIMDLTLKPGEEINIKSISENLGVSRSPVRDALMKLEKEGLADLMPQKGTFVSRINLDRMHEEHFLRTCLEEKTLELFMDRRSEKDLCLLDESLEAQKQFLESGDYPKFLESDDSFHRIFFEAAEKPLCWRVMHSMSGHYRRVRLLVLRKNAEPESIWGQHARLVACIRNGDRDGAASIMKSHLSKLNSEEKELLVEFPDYFTGRNAGAKGFRDFLQEKP
jgi:GntR family transcriptional regulator, rspAB operon transcriptional repressor